MKDVELKVTRIGNSRGVRLPAATLERYLIGDRVVMEERSDGILLRPVRNLEPKLSWAETAAEMAASQEDWRDWDTASADGLDEIPWDARQPKRVAEEPAKYKKGSRRKSRSQK